MSAESSGLRKPKHVPIRTCVACRTAGEKRGLIRVVRTADQVVQIDHSGKLNGRGAYVCNAEICISAAKKAKKLDRGLKCSVPPEVYDELLKMAVNEAPPTCG